MVDKYPQLHFPPIEARIQKVDNQYQIWDVVRSQFQVLTPEEWVRQHCIHWLVQRGYPVGRCSVEKVVPGSAQRYDVVWMDEHLKPFLLVECKAPSVRITPTTYRQGGWYNLSLKAPYTVLTNGLSTFCALNTGPHPEFIPDIPDYPTPSTQ